MCSNLFRVFGATPENEEASTLEASKSPNKYAVNLFLYGVFCQTLRFIPSLYMASLCISYIFFRI